MVSWARAAPCWRAGQGTAWGHAVQRITARHETACGPRAPHAALLGEERRPGADVRRRYAFDAIFTWVSGWQRRQQHSRQTRRWGCGSLAVFLI